MLEVAISTLELDEISCPLSQQSHREDMKQKHLAAPAIRLDSGGVVLIFSSLDMGDPVSSSPNREHSVLEDVCLEQTLATRIHLPGMLSERGLEWGCKEATRMQYSDLVQGMLH